MALVTACQGIPLDSSLARIVPTVNLGTADYSAKCHVPEMKRAKSALVLEYVTWTMILENVMVARMEHVVGREGRVNFRAQRVRRSSAAQFTTLAPIAAGHVLVVFQRAMDTAYVTVA